MIIEDTESFENVFVSNYWYDADGERTVKTSGKNEAIYVNYRASRVQCQVCLSIAEAQPIITESNSEFSGGNTGTARFSLYVSPYLVAGQGGKYTKHIYVGSQRIVSKLGDLASYGVDPRRIPYAGNEADGLTINYKDKYAKQLQSIKDNYKAFDLPYNGKDNDDYVNGQLCPKDIVGCTREFASKFAFLSLARQFCCNDGTLEAAQARAMARTRVANGNFHDKDNYEKMQFYYHPDHLGSSSYITNLDGEVSQHIEYVPFGEVFIEERNNTWNTPYLFNAKEFDEETGMYYYGARYYEPRLSLWMSCDPLQERKAGFTTYAYCENNPVKLFDPDGKFGIPTHVKLVSQALKTANTSKGKFRMLWGTGVVSDIFLISRSTVHLDNMVGYESLSNAYNNLQNSFQEHMGEGKYTKAGVDLHGIADFYSHSNYIDLYKKYKDKQDLDINQIPTFAEAQNIPEFAEILKSSLKTGEYGMEKGNFIQDAIRDKKSNDPKSHHMMNLDKPTSQNGKQVFNDKHSNFDAAYSVALKDITNAIEKSKESKQEE